MVMQYASSSQRSQQNEMNTLIEIDGPTSNETYYLNIPHKNTMFQTNDFKREEIEKSLK